MEGLTHWEYEGITILRADYGLVKDPSQLLHAIMQEQYSAEGECCYSLIDFGYRTFSENFVQEYYELVTDLTTKKRIYAAYLGLPMEHYEDAKRILASIDGKATIAFFESEPAAIKWLLSFRGCVD